MALTRDTLIERVQSSGAVRLLFDTNAVEMHRAFHRLCDEINRLNHTMKPRHIDMFISAVAHTEKLFHLKQQIGAPFDVRVAMAGLTNVGVKVLPFAIEHAHATALLLGKRYEKRDDWRDAKRKRCLQCLGARPEDSVGKNCSATIDWLIAAHAIHENCILVTDDRGIEFRDVLDKITMDTLEQAIGELLRTSERESPEAGPS